MIGEIMGNYVPSTWYNSYNPMSCVTEPSYRDEGIRKNWEERNPLNTRCFMHANVSNYVKEYGFFGLEDKTSIWMNQTLPAPTLNISAFYIPEPYDEVLYGRNWTDPRTNSMPFLDKKRLAYSYSPGNQTYSLNHIETYGSCQPVSEIAAGNDSVRETYQWGFSYIQLFVMTILLVLWTIGVSAMWLKAHMTMRMRGGCDKPMGFKGVLELAAAIQKQLQETNPNDLSHDQLSEEIKKRLRGGSIQLEREEATAMYGLWKGLWGWVIERKWWFTTLLVFAGFATLIYISRSISWFFIPTAAVLIAVVVGQSGKSRAMLTLACVILGTIVFVAVESALYQRERY
nr:uncharacterized protein CTRU02_14351 [Colletotrichum truncatum]KAF6782312.1 hypothetical protein CTRU02_14351 [Colletotrichum truncatum]